MPGLKKMSCPAVSKVEPFHVTGEKPLYDRRQRNVPNLEGKVKMIAHQTVGEYLAGRISRDSKQPLQKFHTVTVINKDRAPVNAARKHMIDRA